MTHGGIHNDPLYEEVELPRDLAIGGVTGIAVWLGAKAFEKLGPKIGFGTLRLGAAANAVSMAVGIPILAGYAATYAIDGRSGVDKYEYFLTHPSQWLQLTVQSVVAVGANYSNYDGWEEKSEPSDPFVGFRERREQTTKYPFMI